MNGGRSVVGRRRWLAVHLWLGLSLGALLALVGVTGSLLVFYLEIDRWLNPALSVPRSAAPEHSLQQIFDAIRAAEPGRQRGWRLEIPQGDDRGYTARYYFPEEKAGASFAPLLVTVDPYTLELRARRFWGDFAMTWIYDLHYTLLLGPVGNYVLGIAGLVAILSLASGLYLWWPRGAHRRHAFTWKPAASGSRRNYDVHKLAGFYGLVLSLLLTITGAALELPGWVEPLVARVMPVEPWPTVGASTRPGGAPITLDVAVRRARERFPDASVRWIETPDGPSGVFRVRLQRPGEPSARFPRTFVWLDPGDGRILAVRDVHRRGAGDAVLAWLHPLHSGEAFGMAGRVLVFLGGLLPLVLFATGTIRWRQKRRARFAMARRRG